MFLRPWPQLPHFLTLSVPVGRFFRNPVHPQKDRTPQTSFRKPYAFGKSGRSQQKCVWPSASRSWPEARSPRLRERSPWSVESLPYGPEWPARGRFLRSTDCFVPFESKRTPLRSRSPWAFPSARFWRCRPPKRRRFSSPEHPREFRARRFPFPILPFLRPSRLPLRPSLPKPCGKYSPTSAPIIPGRDS